MEIEHSTKSPKLYAVGSAEINQFCIPIPEGSTSRPSNARKPLCLSSIEEFEVTLNQDEEDQREDIYENPLLRENIDVVACGGVHTLLLTKSFKVYSFGSNDEGALGRKGEETVPALVEIQSPIDMIAAGDCHSLFTSTQENEIYFSGLYRGIVKGHIADKIELPLRISLSEVSPGKKIKNITKVISGNNHSMILADGNVFIRGDSEYFALGKRILDRHKDKVKATSWQGMGLKKVKDIWTGGMHCFASIETKEGKSEYYGWGNNTYGQLGVGDTEIRTFPEYIEALQDMKVVKIVGGEHHTLILNNEGEVYGCGKNDDGQLGLGDDYVPRPLDNQFEVLHAWKPTKVEQLENIIDIFSGPHFSYALANDEGDNELYSWGLARSYVLINGNQDADKSQPYKVLKKILNFEKIVQLSAGGQHVMYLAEEADPMQPNTASNNPNPGASTTLPLVASLAPPNPNPQIPMVTQSTSAPVSSQAESSL